MELERLEYEKKSAEQSSRQKTTFLATISHELRTPVNVIIVGLTEALQTKMNEQEQIESLDLILESSKSLQILLNDLLDVSRMTVSQLVIQTNDFCLDSLMKSLLTHATTIGKPKGLTVKMHYDEDIPTTLRGDSERLRQVISNILSNAVNVYQQEWTSVLLNHYFAIRYNKH